jgi:uncharacterized protein YggE
MTQKIQKEINMNKKILFFAVLAFALVLSACAPAGPTTINQAAPENVRTLNVNGLGQVYLTPDIAYIYIGVHNESATVSEAVDANKTQTTSVIDAIKKAGVAEKDINTTNFSIYPSQQYGPDGTVTGTMYMVDNTVFVTVRDLDGLGDLLDSAISAGANNINSIQFDVADKTAAMKEARAKAVENAKTQAQELANPLAFLVNIKPSTCNVASPYTIMAKVAAEDNGGCICADQPAGYNCVTVITYTIKITHHSNSPCG